MYSLSEIEKSEDFKGLPAPVQETVRTNYKKKYGDADLWNKVSQSNEFNSLEPATKETVAINFDKKYGGELGKSYLAQASAERVGERSVVGDVVSHFGRGVVKAAEMGGRALQVTDGTYKDEGGFLDKVGGAVQTWAEEAPQKYDILTPDKSELAGDESWVKQKVMEGVESLGPSLTPFVAGAAGTLAGGPLVGAALGIGTLGAVFGGGTYHEKRQELEKYPNLPEEQKHSAALKYSGIEVGGELISDIILFGVGKAVPGAGKLTNDLAKQGIRKLLSVGPKQVAKQFGKVYLAEWGTETGQHKLQSNIDFDLGIGDQVSILESAVETAIPTAVITLTLGLATGGYNVKQKRKLLDDLNSDDPAKRIDATKTVYAKLKKEDADIAAAWRDFSSDAIKNQKKIDVDANFLTGEPSGKEDSAKPEADVEPTLDVESGPQTLEDLTEEDVVNLNAAVTQIKGLPLEGLQNIDLTNLREGNPYMAGVVEAAINERLQELQSPVSPPPKPQTEPEVVDPEQEYQEYEPELPEPVVAEEPVDEPEAITQPDPEEVAEEPPQVEEEIVVDEPEETAQIAPETQEQPVESTQFKRGRSWGAKKVKDGKYALDTLKAHVDNHDKKDTEFWKGVAAYANEEQDTSPEAPVAPVETIQPDRDRGSEPQAQEVSEEVQKEPETAQEETAEPGDDRDVIPTEYTLTDEDKAEVTRWKREDLPEGDKKLQYTIDHRKASIRNIKKQIETFENKHGQPLTASSVKARLKAIAIHEEKVKIMERLLRGSAKDTNKPIGKNQDGRDVYEDENGVRAYSEDGFIITAPVTITPGGSTAKDSLKSLYDKRRTEYLTAEEVAGFAAEEDIPEFEEMVKEAARWRGATMQLAALVKDDTKAAMSLSRQTTKGDMDAYLMRKFGIDESTARTVSNELTSKDIPADMSANLNDYSSEEWFIHPKEETPDPFANNTVFTSDAVEKARARLKEKRKNLSAGFDPELMQDLFTIGGAYFEAGVRNFSDWSKAILKDLGKEFKPYLRGTYENLRNYPDFDIKGISTAAEIDEYLSEKPEKAAETSDSDIIRYSNFFYTEYIAGRWNYKTIAQARKAAAGEFNVGDTENGEFKKTVDEAIEYAVVKISRDLIASGRENGQTGRQIFNQLVGLYSNQPRLGTRTSDSVRNQAFSTPSPIAFLGNWWANIGTIPGKTVYEPTAGTGMLLIGADPRNVIANELDKTRAEILRDQGFSFVTDFDAMEGPTPQGDIVITNPPFGKVKNEDGTNKKFTVDGFATTEIDQAITLKALSGMAEDGDAVLIIGGLNKQIPEDERAKAYSARAKKEYFNHLYDNYNVKDHFTIAGELYQKHGAGWPIDIILISGKGQSPKATPDFIAPPIYRTFEEIGDRLEKIDTQEAQNFGVDATRQQQIEATPVRGPRTPATGNTFFPGPAGNDTTIGQTGGTAEESELPGSEAGSDIAPGQPGTPTVRSDRPDTDGQSTSDIDNGRPGDTDVSATEDERTNEVVRDTGSEGTIEESDAGQVAESTGTGGKPTVVASQGQTHYKPKSGSGQIGTLTPQNMSKSIQDALSNLAEKYGSIDQFVQEALKYPTKSELYQAFSAEQIDAVALALDNIQKGSGFILGDQTGIGKGRVVASMIRYAILNNKVPVFVTEKQALYADMYRDMVDIGFDSDVVAEIMQTNNDTVFLDEEKGIKLTSPSGWNSKLGSVQGLPTVGKKKVQKKIVFTTYDQMNIQYVGKTDVMAPRRRFLSQLVNNKDVVLIMDEAHNAGGSGDLENLRPDPDTGIVPHPRALLFRQLIPDANGVVYSSATYAKNPDVMSLYSATDLKLGVGGDINALSEAITSGGIPYQQITAAMLSEAGQYIRRERSFDGVEYTPVLMEVDTEIAERVSGAMAIIREFEETHIAAALEMDADAMGSNAVGNVGEQTHNFTSLMHNIINQMLLSLKVKPASERAIKILEDGRDRNEQVVMTVANTMGAFIANYADANKLIEGNEMPARFNDLLQRYLYNTRIYTTDDRDENGDKIRFWLSDEEIGPEGAAAYNAVYELIEGIDLRGLPVSPIDYMHNEFKKAGFPALEITGRDETIDYSGDVPLLSRRDPKDRKVNGRNKTIRLFNTGKNRVVILNRSGSTGISLHASERNPVNGQGKRTMMVVQAEQDINVHMQMLGRVHRTGQVIEPAYIQAVANVPAEKKPAALLVARMAGLNANTTADADSLFLDKTSVNFLNRYGDLVASQAMAQNPDLNRRLGSPYVRPEPGRRPNLENLAKKVTGRLPLLRLVEQEEVYNAIEEAYKDLIAELDATGRNDLEAKTFDLDAKTLEKTEVVPATGTSPFQAAVYAEKVDMKRIGKPFKTEEVLALVEENRNEGEQEAQDAVDEFETYKSELLDAARQKLDDAATDAERAGATENLTKVTDRMRDIESDFVRMNTSFKVGNPISLDLNMGDGAEAMTGIVVGKVKRGNPRNPLALSAWRVRVAVADGIRIVNLPFSRFSGNSSVPRDQRENGVVVHGINGNLETVAKQFDAALTKSREERWVITGNLFTGYATFRAANGRIMSFTRDDGVLDHGVLMPVNFDPQETMDSAPVALETFDQADQYMTRVGNAIINLRQKGKFRITHQPGGIYRVATDRAVRTGARYYRDDRQLLSITGQFYSVGDRMQSDALTKEQVQEVYELFQRRGNTWFADTELDVARDVVYSGLIANKGEDIKYSQADTGLTSHANVASELSKTFGRVWNRLTSKGTVKIVKTQAEARKIVEGLRGAYPDATDPIRYSKLPKDREPKKTVTAYKLFRTLKTKPGEIFPLFIGKSKPTPVGEWIEAEFIPTKGFADRPGWHAGVQPLAPHLMKKDGTMQEGRVWAEVEIPADTDWQQEADRQKTRDIRDRVPTGGHYRFKTNKMQGGAWIIGGAIKVNRILSEGEVASINEQHLVDVKYSKDGRIQGFTDGTTAYLVEDGIKKGESTSVLAHELGSHVRKLGFKKSKDFQNILKAIERNRGKKTKLGKEIADVEGRVPRDTKPEHVNEEILSYMVEGKPESTVVKRFVTLLKKWLFKLGVSADIFNAQDFRNLAMAAIREEATVADSIGEFAQSAKMSLAAAKSKIQNLPAFKKWFGNSKVVGEDGEPLVVYHGTASDVTYFDEKRVGGSTGSKVAGKGFYFTSSPNVASGFATFASNKGKNPSIIPVYLKLENPIIVDDTGFDGTRIRSAVEEAREGGHDGVVLKNTNDSIGNGSVWHIHGKRLLVDLQFFNEVYDPVVNGDMSPSEAEAYLDEVVEYLQEEADSEANKDVKNIFEDEISEWNSIRADAKNQFSNMEERKINQSDVYVVFDNTNIKSIFNTKWDGSNPDIMMSVAARDTTGEYTGTSNVPPVNTSTSTLGAENGPDRLTAFLDNHPKYRDRWERFVYWFADKDDPRRLVMKRAGEQEARADILAVERLRGKATADEVEQKLFKNLVEPLQKHLVKAKIKVKEFEDYVYALHVPERNKRMQQVNAKLYIDKLRKHLPDDAKQEIDDQMAEVRAVAVLSGLERGELQDQFLNIMEEAYAKISELQSALDLDQSAHDSRVFTKREIQKGTPERLQVQLDGRQEAIDSLNNVQEDWRLKSPRFAGITDQEAQTITDKVEADPRLEKFNEAQRMLADINRFRLDTLFRAGQLSKTEYDSLLSGYDYYVPLHRDPDQVGYIDAPPATGRITGALGKPLKVAKGSLADVVDIFAHSVSNAQSAIVRKHKALAGKALYNFVQDNPDSGITIEEQSKEPTHDSEGNVVMYPTPMEKENELYVRVDGKRYVLKFDLKDKTVARFLDSIKNSDVQLSGPIRALGVVTRLLASINTMYSPEFVISNFARDLQTAGVNMEDSVAKGLQGKVFKSIYPAIKGIMSAEFKDNNSSYWSKAYRDFSENGGKIGWMQGYEEISELSKKLETQMRDLEGKNVPKKTVKGIIDIIQKTNLAIENGVRLAVYQHAVNAGVSKQQAALAASNLTVDFTRRGTAGPAINALYMFFNAGLQGGIRLGKAVTRSSRVRAMVGGIMGTGFAFQMLAYMMGGDDEEGVPYIDGIPDYVKERNMVFMLPNSGGRYVAIPMPYGYSAFYSIGQEAATAFNTSQVRGKKYETGKGAVRLLGAIMSSFNPIYSGTLAQTLAPTVLDPVMQVAENKSWTGNPLMPEQNKYDVDKADAYRYWKSVSQPSKVIAKELYRLTGGTGEYSKAGIDVSPETIDMWYDTVTGSAGRFVKNTVLLPFSIASGDLQERNIPFLRRLSGKWDDRAISGRYYDALDQIRRDELNYLKPGKTYGASKEEIAEMKRLVKVSKTTKKVIRKLNGNKKKLEESGKPAEAIDKKILNLQIKLLKSASA